MRQEELLQALEGGGLLDRLEPVYGEDAAGAARRLADLIRGYAGVFPGGEEDVLLFSVPGRTELGGNHTDHQWGRCLAGSVNLDTIACAAPNGTNLVRIQSRNHRMAEVSLDDLSIRPAESGSSVSMVRGVAARLREMGYTVGGFNAYTTTRVLRSSGLSSSAAFEVLVGNHDEPSFLRRRPDASPAGPGGPVRGKRLLRKALRPDGPAGLRQRRGDCH